MGEWLITPALTALGIKNEKCDATQKSWCDGQVTYAVSTGKSEDEARRATIEEVDSCAQCLMTEEDKKTGYKGGEPTGVFTMTEAQSKAAATEVIGTHKGLTGAAASAYLDTYWAKAWGHFDVNRTGKISVHRTPELMRFLCSDQYMSLG